MIKMLVFLSIFTVSFPAMAEEQPYLIDEREVFKIDGKRFVAAGDMILEVNSDNLLSVQVRPVEKWPNGILPIEFDDKYSDSEKETFFKACDLWSAVSVVSCVPKAKEHADYIYVVANATKNNSHVGKKGRRQTMNIASRGSKIIIAHEIAHALGFTHQHNSPVRDSYVEIVCVDNPDCKNTVNYNIHKNAIQFGDYDYCSMMHYKEINTDISGNILANINIKREKPSCLYEGKDHSIGQRKYLTTSDKLGVVAAYGRDSDDENFTSVPNLVGIVVDNNGSSQWLFERFGVRTNVVERRLNGKVVEKIPPNLPDEGCIVARYDTRVLSQSIDFGRIVSVGETLDIKINHRFYSWNRC